MDKLSGNLFSFRPFGFHKLENSIYSLSWDVLSRKISITTKETSDFLVYKWIEDNKKKLAETGKSPFCDVEDRVAVLILKNTDGHEVAQVTFKGIAVSAARCCFFSALKELSFDVEIGYDEAVLKQFVPNEE